MGGADMYNWIGVLYIIIAIAYGVDTCAEKQSYNQNTRENNRIRYYDIIQ